VLAEIIAVGSELLTPYRQDTNSLFLTGRLNQLGIEVAFKTVIGDNRGHLVSAARIALERAELVIFMGGLGPTEDDLTREAVAEALNLPLRRDPDLVARLYARFAKRRLKMSDNNLKQGDVIAGAIPLENRNGSAPGQWLEGSVGHLNKVIILLPGPPHELQALFEEQCLERLRVRYKNNQQFIAKRELKVALLGESECDARIAPIYTKHTDVQTTILARPGEVQIHLQARAAAEQQAEKLISDLSEELEDELDDFVFSRAGESLEQIVEYYLEMRGATISVAESCTGGLIGERLTSLSGSSRSFLGGAIVYSNDLKTTFSCVPPLLIAEHGAVSREVAIAMAEGIRKQCKSTYGLSVTGVAGPKGGTDEKPVGLVYHALTDGKKTDVVKKIFPGDRERIRWAASQQALDMVRRRLI
jgi:nicotinamide-nucleotide amidase